jgi:glyoxylase-like metal-dependent hydrolase (beta-lactamase superfamily II)
MLVRLKGKRLVVLTGDSVPCQENFLYSIIPRNHLDPDQALRTIQKLHELMKEEKAFLIYGHDPVQWEKIKEPPDYYD